MVEVSLEELEFTIVAVGRISEGSDKATAGVEFGRCVRVCARQSAFSVGPGNRRRYGILLGANGRYDGRRPFAGNAMALPEFLKQDADGYIHVTRHRISLQDLVYYYNEGYSPEALL
jgi:hypothetical protein